MEEEKALETQFQELFGGAESPGGEEEMLRIAAKYSRQLNARQIKVLLFLQWASVLTSEVEAKAIRSFVDRWLEWKQFHNSDIFVMRALENISLRRFINENSMKVNIEK